MNSYEVSVFREISGIFYSLICGTLCNDYRGDLLIFEDIQFVAGKMAAEQELYGIIDGYLENNRKIVITGEIPFNRIHCLAPRIQAQIAGGLNLKIE